MDAGALEDFLPGLLSAGVDHLRAQGQDELATMFANVGPQAIATFLDAARGQQERRDRKSRAWFVAELASRFVAGAFEVGEDSSTEELQALARRAVRLAGFLVDESERAAERAARG